MVRILTIAAAAATLATAASALEFYLPDENHWWISSRSQLAAWTRNSTDQPNFDLWVTNPDEKLLPPKIAIAQGNVDITRESLEIPNNAGVNLNPGDNYRLIAVQVSQDPRDEQYIFATSKPFTIKAAGAAYPDAPVTTPGATPSSATDSTAAATGTSAADDNNGNNSAGRTAAGGVLGVAAVLVSAAAML